MSLAGRAALGLTDLTCGQRQVGISPGKTSPDKSNAQVSRPSSVDQGSDDSNTLIDLDRCLDEKERSMKYDLFLGDLESWYMDSNWTLISQKYQYIVPVPVHVGRRRDCVLSLR